MRIFGNSSALAWWSIDPGQYPQAGTFKQKLHFMLGYAILAPSTFNSQPWVCKLSGQRLHIYIDSKRLTEASDKSGRFGVVSIGCFIQNLIVAGQQFGWHVKVQLNNQPISHNHLIASIDFLPQTVPADPENKKLFEAIPHRATNRSLSLDFQLDDSTITKLKSFTQTGQQLHILTKQEYQQPLSSISHQADLEVWSNILFRREHVQWVRHNLTTQPDGMPGYGVGVKLIPSFLAKPIILSRKFTSIQAGKNIKAINSSNYYLVLTSKDEKASWAKNGQLFEQVSLYLTSLDISAAPMGQFIENATARTRLQQLIASTEPPQLFIRLNRPSAPVKHSPRLSVDDIMQLPN